LEPQLGATWRELFAPTAVGPLDDFFKDLGGHSLLAARMVSRMRQRPEFCDLSVLDVYNFPTVRTLAAELRSRHEAVSRIPGAGASPLPVRPTSRAGYGLCVLAQTVSLWVIAGLFSMQWLTPYLAYCWLIERGMGVIDAIAVSLAVLLAFYPLLMAASIAVKWAVIGRYKAGDHPLWGWYYLRWWFVNQVLSVVPIDYLAGTPLLSLYYRLMGARIGHNVHFGADNISAFDLVSVGDDSSLGIETMLMGYSLEGGRLRLGPVTVGRGCFIGARSVLRPYTVMEDGARLEDLSLLPEGGRIPRGQTWIGSPARPIWQTKRQTEAIPPAVRPGRLRRAAFAMPYVLGVLLVPAVCLIALFPGLIWLNYVTREYGGYWFLLLAPAVTLAFVLLMALEIVLVKWLLLGRVRPGTYDVHGWFYFRKWFVDQLMDLSLDLLGPLYATLYLAPWYRLLGAKLGRRAEVSTASATSPDLLAIDDGSFIADAVCLGASRVEG
jgi:non-ribosomal peptide synthetase-like protein